MSVKIKTSLKNLQKSIKSLSDFDNVVYKTTLRLKLLLLKNWSKGIGSDGRKFDRLSDKYRDIKGASGRAPIRNLLYSGNMVQDLDPTSLKDSAYMLKFKSGRERKKAQGNVKYAKNMMLPVSDRINIDLQKYAFKLYQGK